MQTIDPPNPPDPHGQAALMLVEAIAHLLVERGVLGKAQICAAIAGVEEVKSDLRGEEPGPAVRGSLRLLAAVRESFEAI